MKTKAMVLPGLMLTLLCRGADLPNIVLIVADDLGYSDAAFTMDYAMTMRTTPGWDTNALAEVMTPNMDRLADQGVVFTSGYVNGAVCSPTRAGLMLGRYEQRVAVYDAGAGGMGFNLYEDKSRTITANDYPRINPILPEFLRQAPAVAGNYVCGVFGKWHLGIDGIYELENSGALDVGGRPNKQDTAYASIGANVEVPIDSSPIAGVSTNYTDPDWRGGSPWHCANRGFDEWLYFMGRGAHDYWDPNGIYDAFDTNNIIRRTVGLDPRRNPGTGDDSVPTSAWGGSSPYAIHPDRVSSNYLTVRLAEAACDFIEKNAGGERPFFCYVPFNAAHSPSQTPYHVDPASYLLPLGTASRYTNSTVIADWFNPKTPDPDWFPDPLYIYEQYATNAAAFRYFSGGDRSSDDDVRKRCITLAMIQWMDKGIGRIAQRLRDPDDDGDESDSVFENTIILFISDNGGASGMNAANAPLRGNKATLWEGGIRSPFIFSWPALLKPQNGTHINDLGETVANQQLIHTPVIAMDFLPTLLDINGLDPLEPSVLLNAETRAFYDYTPDGKSLMPLIRGEAVAVHDYLFWARGSDTAWGAVRKGDWKLHLMTDGGLELYNLADDIAETTNVAETNPELVRELRQAYFAFMDSAAASMREPSPNTRLYMTMSNPPQAAGNGTVENFDYPVDSTLTNGLSNGGANWLGAWNKTSTTDNGLIDAGNLAFGDPAEHYVDNTEGHHYGARRKQIEISRAFSGAPIDTPVWFSCLVNNMEYIWSTGDSTNHIDQQRWEFHPDNLDNTYLRIGKGDTEYSRFVANGSSVDLDVPVDLDDGTYLVVMRMETDVSGNNDSVKAWIIPAGTAINGFTEADLGTPNLNKDDTDLWADGLTSMGFVGDGYQNQAPKAAQLDNVRLSFDPEATEEERLETLHSGAGEGGGITNRPDAVTIVQLQTAGVNMQVEYDEIAGWLPEGAIIETATSLVSNDWTEVAADIEMIDRWDGLITRRTDLPIDAATNRFYRIR